MKVKRQV